MGRDGFYTYDGSAVRELPCEVSDRVFRFMDSSSYHNVFAVANAKFNEIVWFYTSRDQEGEEVIDDGETVIKKVNNRYVTLRLRSEHMEHRIDQPTRRRGRWNLQRSDLHRRKQQHFQTRNRKRWSRGRLAMG